jgi:hypothetical protein
MRGSILDSLLLLVVVVFVVVVNVIVVVGIRFWLAEIFLQGSKKYSRKVVSFMIQV